jgi:putative lipoic acid-binding regulatory protein
MSTSCKHPFDGRKARIDYPCVWQYKLIGLSREAVQAAVAANLGDAPYSLSSSHQSGGGKYISMNLEVSVDSEKQRLDLYHALTAHPAVRMVL